MSTQQKFSKTSEIATVETRLKEKGKTVQGNFYYKKLFFSLKRIGYSMQKEIMVDSVVDAIATKDGWV